MSNNNDRQMTNYDDTLSPEGKGWLDITTQADYITGYKVFLNTLTGKRISYPFVIGDK